MTRTITVFGSALPKPGGAEYEDAYTLALTLATAGFNICSGGNRGVMEAVSKAAVHAGREAIGITVAPYANPNTYLTKHIECRTLFERVTKLIECGDGFAIMQGGTGTLLELAAVWELINKKMMTVKPVVCHSGMWRDLVKIIDRQMATEHRKAGLIACRDTVKECADYLISALA
jgi:uncharacterized protein (TIGR00730 family)